MSAAQAEALKVALLDHGVPLVLCTGPLGAWNVAGADWTAGHPTGVVQHNTATPSATGPTGAPSLEWLLSPGYSKPAANLLTARGTARAEGVATLGGSPTAAVTYAASLRSALHCGRGGPWDAAGAWADAGHVTLLGVEHDAQQVRGGLTDAQIEAGARIGAAVADMNGGDLRRIITHTCWCDGCHLGPDGGPIDAPLPTRGRKDDTVGCGWDNRGKGPDPYNAPWWRDQARQYLTGTTPTPTPREAPTMILLNLPRSKWRTLAGNTLADPGTDGADVLRRAGVPVYVCTQAEWDRLHAVYPFVVK